MPLSSHKLAATKGKLKNGEKRKLKGSSWSKVNNNRKKKPNRDEWNHHKGTKWRLIWLTAFLLNRRAQRGTWNFCNWVLTETRSQSRKARVQKNKENYTIGRCATPLTSPRTTYLKPLGSATVTEEGSIDLGKQGKPTRRKRESPSYLMKEKMFD